MATRKKTTKKTPAKKAGSQEKQTAAGTTKKAAAKTMPAAGRLQQDFPIVGMGASAGGLEALERFFDNMAPDSGIAFVVVSHLDPNHVSILPEIVQRNTKMKVSQVTDGMTIVPNQIFIIPPGKEMVIFNRTLQLMELSRPLGINLPIDTFLRSLAQDQGSWAIGIILSGTGTDGTLGVRSLKGESGMVMVQDAESAKYDGMPGSAIATGLADFILPPEKMPEKLLTFVTHQNLKKEKPVSLNENDLIASLQKIFVLLRATTDHDFSHYKKNTICRRIERRMHVHQIDNIHDYIRYLQESAHETKILFKELLIGVTSFFRDPEAYENLRNDYLPDLLLNKPDDYQVRIWVPGCSSGEEAYTIAILVQECMERMGRHFTVQVFGTDLDEEAISIARAGSYPASISADVSEERLRKYFTKEDNYFQVKKTIREMVVFAPQNVIKDPPFTKLDLLCCRNLLIYFGSELQKKLLPVFHYSLKHDGLLFLGSSESIGQATDLFVLLDKKWKIFKRRLVEKAGQPILEFPVPGPAVELPVRGGLEPLKEVKEGISVKLLKAILSQSDILPCAVVDDMANIIYIHGRTGRYLEPAQGEASINILEMARPGLKAGLTNAIRKMANERQEITIKGLQVKCNGGLVFVDLVLKPLPDLLTGSRGLMLVLFEERGDQKSKDVVGPPAPEGRGKSAEVKRLEGELLFTKENLQTTIEELETSNEELKSTNEELQSTNEELQSTNEELETSKEELQSLNEESATVNSELQSRIDELVEANDDIKNLLDATEIATIFLDIDLNVRRFTPKVTELFHLTGTDIGRPIKHFATTLAGVNLDQCASRVLEDLAVHETEEEGPQGKVFRMKIRPYRTINNVIDGAVVTFEDMTEQRLLMNKSLERERQWEGLVDNTPIGIFIQIDKRFAYLNPFALKLFGARDQSQIVGKEILELLHPDFHGVVEERFEVMNIHRKEVEAAGEKWFRLDGTELDLTVSAIPTTYNGKDGALVFVRTTLAG